MGILDIFGGGGGGGDGGAGALLEFQRKQQKRLREESKEAREEARTVSSFRRQQLARRTGFTGLVGVGEAVRPTQQRLANRIAGLATDDPERTAFTEAVAQRRQNVTKSRQIVSGEEFDIRQRVRDFEEDFEDKGFNISLHDAQKLQKKLEAFQTERGGRHAGRKDLAELLEKVTARADRKVRAAEAQERRRKRKEERERREREELSEGGTRGTVESQSF